MSHAIETRLFVYGTLAPGRSNHHILAPFEGTWIEGSVRGTLLEAGWGAALGYPALIPDPNGEPVTGSLLISSALHEQWPMLDDFEGEGYERVAIEVSTATGERIEAYVYALRGGPGSTQASDR